MPGLMPGAEPFWLPAAAGARSPAAARTGVLLIHGFTATPHQMLDLGRYLAERGVTAVGPRLAGHATGPRDLERARWTDWYYAILDAYAMLRPQVDRLWAIGLSLGALLALHLAADQEITGVGAFSTPLVLRDQRLVQLGRALPVRYIRKRLDGPPPRDPNLARYISYPIYPVRAVMQMLTLQKVVRAELPRIRVPAILIHSRTDTLAPPDNMAEVYRLLGSQDKAMHWLPDSDHVITMDSARHEVCELLYTFMAGRGEGL